MGSQARHPVKRPPALRMMVVTDSTNIAAVGYAPDRELLRVRFRDGSEYEYTGFKPIAYSKLVSAESIGVHYAHEIRGKYTSRRRRRPRARAHVS